MCYLAYDWAYKNLSNLISFGIKKTEIFFARE